MKKPEHTMPVGRKGHYVEWKEWSDFCDDFFKELSLYNKKGEKVGTLKIQTTAFTLQVLNNDRDEVSCWHNNQVSFSNGEQLGNGIDAVVRTAEKGI